VLFNWRHRTIDGGDESSWVDVVANYFKPGPAVNEGDIRHRICMPQHANMFAESPVPGKWYVADNFVEGFPEISADNWKGGVQFEKGNNSFDSAISEADLKAHIDHKRSLTPIPVVAIRQQTAKEAYELVLAGAGATLPKRDPVDTRIIEQVRTGTVKFGKNG